MTYTAAGRYHRLDCHVTGFDLDAAGDQIIAYQWRFREPHHSAPHRFRGWEQHRRRRRDHCQHHGVAVRLHAWVNAVAVSFDNSLYAGPTSPEIVRRVEEFGQLVRGRRIASSVGQKRKADYRPRLRQFDYTGADYETLVASADLAVARCRPEL